MVLQEAKAIFDKLGDNPTGRAYSLGDIGMVYANTGKNNLAEKNINEAIADIRRNAGLLSCL